MKKNQLISNLEIELFQALYFQLNKHKNIYLLSCSEPSVHQILIEEHILLFGKKSSMNHTLEQGPEKIMLLRFLIAFANILCTNFLKNFLKYYPIDYF